LGVEVSVECWVVMVWIRLAHDYCIDFELEVLSCCGKAAVGERRNPSPMVPGVGRRRASLLPTRQTICASATSYGSHDGGGSLPAKEQHSARETMVDCSRRHETALIGPGKLQPAET
jgi:hypothetical protein